jgi:ABC-2 type transport system ATP-binding protein
MTGAISLQGVSKSYRVYPQGHERLREMLNLRRSKGMREFWALRDIDLEIEPGTTLGLLGRNGAGKSTLLQVISGVSQPTRGTLRTKGRISALLQLGAGFNPEFTGRENALMNGLFLGLDRREMLERFDDIEAFADLGEFMDQPVKNYSSGMRARLGFAVAVNVEPDILLVDESLSVGDGVFKHMGVQKMRELRDTGVTIIFVSHSTNMIKNFCTEAAVLHKGRLVAQGDTSETVDEYQAILADASTNKDDRTPHRPSPPTTASDNKPVGTKFKEDPELKKRSERFRHGTGEARIQNVEVLDELGNPVSLVDPTSNVTVRVHVRYLEDVEDSLLRISLRNKSGLDVFSTSTNLEKTPIRHRRAEDRIVVDFRFQVSLRHGPYSVAAGISPGTNKEAYLDRIDVAAAFEIDRPSGRGGYGGLVHLPTQVTVAETGPSQDQRKHQRPA